jgi:hypothetical protein
MNDLARYLRNSDWSGERDAIEQDVNFFSPEFGFVMQVFSEKLIIRVSHLKESEITPARQRPTRRRPNRHNKKGSDGR